MSENYSLSSAMAIFAARFRIYKQKFIAVGWDLKSHSQRFSEFPANSKF